MSKHTSLALLWLSIVLLANSTIEAGKRAVVAEVEGLSLKEAVASFNEKASVNKIGASQAPLTEAEVIAAIRGWIRERTKVDDTTYDSYETIADTRRLPEGARIEFTTGWQADGYDFTVWWIDLTVMTGKDTGYGYRIRDRKISSRPARADGQIVYVSKRQDMIFVNLGSDDGISSGQRFVVYAVSDLGEQKAAIEVTRLVSAHLAEARILNHDAEKEEPLLEGDLIQTFQADE